jgi:hypothetical protein
MTTNRPQADMSKWDSDRGKGQRRSPVASEAAEFRIIEDWVRGNGDDGKQD